MEGFAKDKKLIIGLIGLPARGKVRKKIKINN